MGGISRRNFLKLARLSSAGMLLDRLGLLNYVNYISHGDTNSKKVALTFDDGWLDYKNQKVIDVLNDFGINSSFFVVGRVLNLYKEQWHSAISEGHEIFNHTYNHKKLSDPKTEWYSEIMGWETAYKRAELGTPERIIRFPFNEGADMPSLYNWLAGRGFKAVVGWNKVSEDTGYSEPTKDNIENIVKNVDDFQGGDIVLFHFLESTAEALPHIIERGYNRGLEFVKVTKLPGTKLYEPPPADLEYLLHKLGPFPK